MDDRSKKFEDLFATYSDAIFRHLYYRLGSRERAIELTQEVFMRTWQHLASGKVIEYERAFLYRIARNLFINEIRTDRHVYSLDQMNADTGFEVVDTKADAFQFTQQQELLHCLDRLSDSYREVLVMRYIDGLAVKDIAELLEEQETNISMRITRALEKLRSEYK